MLVVFHRESWGGERFYDELTTMSLDPSRYIHAIEFYYAAMELGFEGKYRDLPDGYREHQTQKNNTYLLLKKYRDLELIPLSKNWEGSNTHQNRLLKTLPQWVLWSFTGCALTIIFLVFGLLLSYQTDPVKRQIVNLFNTNKVETAPSNYNLLDQRFSSEPDLLLDDDTLFETLQAEFADELSQQLVVIEQTPRGIMFRLTDANLFNSGSNTLSAGYISIIEELGRVLVEEPVRVDITGHSDDVPIRTIRYADNWALSEARAQSVKDILQAFVTDSFAVSARGLADTENLVPNDNDANRALNRRVEILIRG